MKEKDNKKKWNKANKNMSGWYASASFSVLTILHEKNNIFAVEDWTRDVSNE